MKIDVDFNTPFTSMYGVDIRVGPEPDEGADDTRITWKIGHILVAALGGTWEGDKRSGNQRVNDSKLAMQIIKDTNEFNVVPLTDEQRTHLRQMAERLVPEAFNYYQIRTVLHFDDEEGVDDEVDTGESGS